MLCPNADPKGTTLSCIKDPFLLYLLSFSLLFSFFGVIFFKLQVDCTQIFVIVKFVRYYVRGYRSI